jgi:hypothetical protein
MPIGWLGVFFLMLSMFIFAERGEKRIKGLWISASVGLGGYYVMWRQGAFDCVDELWDDGQALIVRNKGKEERIPLENIVNASKRYPQSNFVTLELREPSLLGKKIVFSLPTIMMLRVDNAGLSELINRIDAAKMRRRETGA